MRTATVVLAAGLGTRMHSSTPKILHAICGKPIIGHVLDSIARLKSDRNIVVTGPNNDMVGKILDLYPVTIAVQKEPKGTGDALRAAALKLKGFKGTILVMCGDTPLVSESTLRRLLRLHKDKKEDLSIVSFTAEGTHSYGRIVRKNGRVEAIVEDRDADEEQRTIREVNGGIYAMGSRLLDLLREIEINSAKGEYYLTDIVGIAVNKGYRVGAHILGNETELTGINTREDLCRAGRYLNDRILRGWMNRGVSFMDAGSTFIWPEVRIGSDTIIYPNVHIEGRTIVGRGCMIYPNTRIIDSVIGDGVIVKDSTVIEESAIKDRAVVGPFSHIRPGSVIGRSCKIGNFVEVKKSVIGSAAKASHLSYIGDAEIGRDVNIGAGTITCNYDGEKKHRTIIGDGSFVGSDTQFVAPVKVGKGAYIGAGSTITKDVPPLALAVSRTKQENIEKWALRKQGTRDKRRKSKSKK